MLGQGECRHQESTHTAGRGLRWPLGQRWAARIHLGAEPEKLVLVWYGSAEDWLTLPGRQVLHWRPQCSVVAEVLARYGGRAVLFDAHAYATWRKGRKDSEPLRAQWAAEQD